MIKSRYKKDWMTREQLYKLFQKACLKSGHMETIHLFIGLTGAESLEEEWGYNPFKDMEATRLQYNDLKKTFEEVRAIHPQGVTWNHHDLNCSRSGLASIVWINDETINNPRAILLHELGHIMGEHQGKEYSRSKVKSEFGAHIWAINMAEELGMFKVKRDLAYMIDNEWPDFNWSCSRSYILASKMYRDMKVAKEEEVRSIYSKGFIGDCFE
jgi:hypothetical protein